MKTKLFLSVAIAICLCLGACTGQRQPVTGTEENSASDSLSGSQGESRSAYTIENAPFFDVTFEGIGKIYAYDAALGEGWTVSDPETINSIISKMRDIEFYNEVPSVDPVTETLSHQCFDYLEFYERAEDTSPIFCMGLDPFYIEINDEKTGPYVTELPDGFVSDLLKLFLSGR